MVFCTTSTSSGRGFSSMSIHVALYHYHATFTSSTVMHHCHGPWSSPPSAATIAAAMQVSELLPAISQHFSFFFPGEFVDGQTIVQHTNDFFIDGQTIVQLTGEFVDCHPDDGQTTCRTHPLVERVTSEFVDGQTLVELTVDLSTDRQRVDQSIRCGVPIYSSSYVRSTDWEAEFLSVVTPSKCSVSRSGSRFLF